jgi:hypothetical protein
VDSDREALVHMYNGVLFVASSVKKQGVRRASVAQVTIELREEDEAHISLVFIFFL